MGHDIGLMVAYAYAAQFPAETDKLVLMDAFLPGVEGWEAIYNNPTIWHFRFNGPTPEALVRGRERTYFEHFWNDFAAEQDAFDSGGRSRQRTQRPTPVLGACAPRGRTSSRFSRRRQISLTSRGRS